MTHTWKLDCSEIVSWCANTQPHKKQYFLSTTALQTYFFDFLIPPPPIGPFPYVGELKTHLKQMCADHNHDKLGVRTIAYARSEPNVIYVTTLWLKFARIRMVFARNKNDPLWNTLAFSCISLSFAESAFCLALNAASSCVKLCRHNSITRCHTRGSLAWVASRLIIFTPRKYTKNSNTQEYNSALVGIIHLNWHSWTESNIPHLDIFLLSSLP